MRQSVAARSEHSDAAVPLPVGCRQRRCRRFDRSPAGEVRHASPVSRRHRRRHRAYRPRGPPHERTPRGHPVVRRPRTPAIDLGTLGGYQQRARAVAEPGLSSRGEQHHRIRGHASVPATLVLDGFTDLGTLGGSNSEAWRWVCYNSYVAGRAQLATSKYHAFLWTAGYPTAGPMIIWHARRLRKPGGDGVNDLGSGRGLVHYRRATRPAVRSYCLRDGVMCLIAVVLWWQ